MRCLALAALIFVGGYIDGTMALQEEQIIAEAVKRAEESKAQVFKALAKCMSEPTTIRVGDEEVAICKPRRK